MKINTHALSASLIIILKSQFLRFLLVGLANTILGAGVMFFLYNILHCSYWISSACNYIAGGILSYFLNKYFTFKDSQKSLIQILIFAINVLVCYLIAYGIAKPFINNILDTYSDKIKGNISLLTGMVLYTSLNFLGQKIFVFQEKRK